MQNPTIQTTGRASYAPEDDKLRLYVGRVPRPEYDALRAEGWTPTAKQSCDFVAHWTPQRRDTALAYGDGVIDDEDQTPEERAADRAERFSGYLGKRLNEAGARADSYEAGPSAHGFQSQARAERAAARHDCIADRAGNAWSKAEYWQRRTAGVISHALYKSTPAVRMGRIKILEADLRRLHLCADWRAHLELRLAYENQMCEAAGGRAALVEMVAGGFIGSHQILKVNKSAVTGQVVSVSVMATREGYKKINGSMERATITAPILLNIERLGADEYRAPTAEELEAFNTKRKADKAARPKVVKPSLINPTDADAEKLQAIWNKADREPSKVIRMTQAAYSACSGPGSVCETVTLSEHGKPVRNGYGVDNKSREEVCKVRRAFGGGFNTAYRVVVITDKPQKPLPWEVMEAARAKHPTTQSLLPKLEAIQTEIRKDWLAKDRNQKLLEDAAYVGWVYISSQTQYGWTAEGSEVYKANKCEIVQGAIAGKMSPCGHMEVA